MSRARDAADLEAATRAVLKVAGRPAQEAGGEEAMIDTQEIAHALEEMFAASTEAGEAEPDFDLILAILRERFPGLTMGHVQEVDSIVRARLSKAH